MRSLIILTLALVASLPAQPSITPSPLLGFWAPLDETGGSSFINIAKKPVTGTHLGNPPAITGMVDFARDYDGLSQHSDYPDALEANAWSTGKRFTLECWVRPDGAAGLGGVRVIVDKRASDASGLRGFTFFLYNGLLACQIADGTYDNYISTLALQADAWQHVALTVDRNPSGQSTLFLDGVPWGFDCTSHPGSLVNQAPLRIGARTAGSGGFFAGAIDEVSLYQDALTPSQVVGLQAAGSWGKSKSRCTVPQVVGLAANQSCAGFTARIHNDHVTPRTYAWSLQGVAPSSVSSSCTVQGPGSFSPATGTITVPPCSSVDVPVSVGPPAIAGQAGCYTMVCTEGGDSFWDWGHVVQSTSPISSGDPCSGGSSGETALTAGLNRFDTGAFRLTNGGTSVASFGYRLEVLTPEGLPDLESVALGDLPPGAAMTGALSLAPGQWVELPVSARFVRRDPRRDYSIVLYEDSTGTMTSTNARTVSDALPEGLAAEAVMPTSGHFDLRVHGGLPGNPVYTFFTTDLTSAPFGAFFGIDLSPADFQFQFSAAAAGVAPFLTIPDPEGRAAWSASGFPPGLPLAAVSLSLDPSGLGLLVAKATRLTTW